MACENWVEKLEAYIDGELSENDARSLNEHLRACAACSAETLNRVQQKRMVHMAGRAFTPDSTFRARIQRSIAPQPRTFWNRAWLPLLATAMLAMIVSGVVLNRNRDREEDRQLVSELADLHVATLASANPLDVVSSDRHTVKPWFAGRIPFTFNLPELQDSPFALAGARVSYLNQSPGAELIFRVRQHQISVFIFQEHALNNLHQREAAQSALSFNVRSWSHNGLTYVAISDANAQDLDKLSELIKAAG